MPPRHHPQNPLVNAAPIPSRKGQQRDDAPAIAVQNLRFAYEHSDVLRLDAFSLERGESCALLGPSGCGKSTLVHLLAGLLTSHFGTVKVLGQDLAALSESARDRFRAHHIGFVFQRLHLLPALSVGENLHLAQRLAGTDNGGNRVATLIERLNIAQFVSRKPATLSFGQAQRVAIARALVGTPKLVIADEPTSALDDGHAHDALQLLKEQCEESNTALLVVTHDHRVRGHLMRDFDLGDAP